MHDGEWRQCPDCGRAVWVAYVVEIVYCRNCGAFNHPESMRLLREIRR